MFICSPIIQAFVTDIISFILIGISMIQMKKLKFREKLTDLPKATQLVTISVFELLTWITCENKIQKALFS